MERKIVLNEKQMQFMENSIPELAGSALKRAYYQALATSGKVVEAIDGKLVETSSDGQRRVLKELSKPIHVAVGTKRVRMRAK